MRQKTKTAHLQVTLDPETLIRVDDYRHQRRFSGDVSPSATSKSDAIRTLLRLALMEALPPAHRDIIRRMHKEQAIRRREREERPLITKYRNKLDRTHLVLEPREMELIEMYKTYASSVGGQIESRADVIRCLLEISLEGKCSDDHLAIVSRITTIEHRTGERAQQKWVMDGAVRDEPEETSKKRWLEAKAEIFAEDIKALKAAVCRRNTNIPKQSNDLC
jgi:hypothetical protein